MQFSEETGLERTSTKFRTSWMRVQQRSYVRTNACIRPQSRKLLRCKFPKIDNLQRARCARCARCASCQCRLILSVFYVLYELYIALCVSFAVLWKLHQVLRVCGFEALRIRNSLPSTLHSTSLTSHLLPRDSPAMPWIWRRVSAALTLKPSSTISAFLSASTSPEVANTIWKRNSKSNG